MAKKSVTIGDYTVTINENASVEVDKGGKFIFKNTMEGLREVAKELNFTPDPKEQGWNTQRYGSVIVKFAQTGEMPSLKENTAVVVEETSDMVEVPEEYKGVPIIEITTEEIDVEDPYGSYPSYPTFGIVFHGYADNGRQAIVIMADKHKDLCKQAAKDIEKYIESDEDIPVKVIETKTITGYGEADDIEEIKGVIGVALNEYYDGGSKHLYQYDWESWFPNEAIFCIDDDVFVASNDGSIDFIDLSDEQLNVLKASFFDFHDGLAKKEQDGKWGFINQSGTFVIPAKFDDAQDFSEGLCAVEIDGSWGFIDTKGNVVIEPQFLRGADFQNGQCEVMTDEYDLTIDKKGNVIKQVKSEW